MGVPYDITRRHNPIANPLILWLLYLHFFWHLLNSDPSALGADLMWVYSSSHTKETSFCNRQRLLQETNTNQNAELLLNSWLVTETIFENADESEIL